MKKTVKSLALAAALLLFLTGCSTRAEQATEQSHSVTDGTQPTALPPESPLPPDTTAQNGESAANPETTPEPSPVTRSNKLVEHNARTAASVEQSPRSEYGERTGTDKTYTGLEPLSNRDFCVNDPQNTAGLSTEVKNHSFGVAKNGEAHSISITNSEYYSKFGALSLDMSGNKTIYLTFDCGYENGYTEAILDVLSEKHVPAAFFVTMPYIKSVPELVARMINDGHTVGNHSDNHPNFAKIERSRMADEIASVDNMLRMQFGYTSPFFRFPEGAYSESALELVQSLGYTSVFWSAAYSDWDPNNQKGADYAFETVTSRLHPGCVLLLHAVSSDNAAALGRIIDYATAEGYTFMSLR